MSEFTVITFTAKNTTLKHSAYYQGLSENQVKILHNGDYSIDGVLTTLSKGDVVVFKESIFVDSFKGD